MAEEWPPNQFAEDPDRLFLEKQIRELREELHTERKKRKEFEEWKELTDNRIRQIMAYLNKAALHRVEEQIAE
jgi:hypothetical protein